MSVLERLKAEKSALDQKLTQIDAFVFSEKWRSAPEIERHLLFLQLEIMHQYSSVLNRRILLRELSE